MGSTKVSVPPPPGMSTEEKNLINEQVGQLRTISGILNQQQAAQQEQQNLYKTLSGLYDVGENGELTLNQGKVDALRAQQEEYGAMTDEINKLQSERYLKALRGELPVSEATQQAKESEFNILRENLARRGAGILTGDTPETAAGTSSAAIQSLGEFNRTYKLLEDAQRRGELTSMTPGASPGTSSLNSLSQSFAYSPSNLIQGYGTLATGYANATQPYAQQRNLEYDANVQNAALKSQRIAAMYGLAGQAGATGAIALASSKDFKKDIRLFGESADENSLKSVVETPLYTWRYKSERPGSRPHFGTLTEEAPKEIVSDDGKHLDVASYFGLLSSAIKALDKKIEAIA